MEDPEKKVPDRSGVDGLLDLLDESIQSVLAEIKLLKKEVDKLIEDVQK